FYIFLCSALIVTAGPRNWLSRWILENKAQIFLGNISYSLYLSHYILWHLIYPHLPGSTLAVFILHFSILLVVCLLLYIFLEYPFFHRKTGIGEQTSLINR
ncbi:MAG: hypothetical protein FWF99_01640, partial [Desulfovibrionaceae bacterium]|nr:hypothetical protein [Desulfovibrionaceae bacterium]